MWVLPVPCTRVLEASPSEIRLLCGILLLFSQLSDSPLENTFQKIINHLHKSPQLKLSQGDLSKTMDCSVHGSQLVAVEAGMIRVLLTGPWLRCS